MYFILNNLQDSVDFPENQVFVDWLFNVYAVSYVRIIITKMSYSGSNKAGDQTSFTLLVDSERKRVRRGFQPVLKRADRVHSREIWSHPVRRYFHHKMPCWWISSPIRVEPVAFQSSLQCPRLRQHHIQKPWIMKLSAKEEAHALEQQEEIISSFLLYMEVLFYCSNRILISNVTIICTVNAITKMLSFKIIFLS